MVITNILTRKAPTLAGIEFDAVLENTLVGSVTHTQYPIELGARVTDHRIINPVEWTLTVGISNNPLRTQITDFSGVLTNLAGGSGALASVAGLSAGFLAGSTETRASAALDLLFALMVSGEPFDVDTGDRQLINMVINQIRRDADPSNENGLIAVVELRELPTLRTVLQNNGAALSQLRFGDPAQTQAIGTVNRGELVGVAPSDSTLSAVGGIA